LSPDLAAHEPTARPRANRAIRAVEATAAQPRAAVGIRGPGSARSGRALAGAARAFDGRRGAACPRVIARWKTPEARLPPADSHERPGRVARCRGSRAGGALAGQSRREAAAGGRGFGSARAPPGAAPAFDGGEARRAASRKTPGRLSSVRVGCRAMLRLTAEPRAGEQTDDEVRSPL